MAFYILIIIFFALLILYFFFKYGLVKPFQAVFKSFNTKYIADQLVLEVAEYRREVNRSRVESLASESRADTSVADVSDLQDESTTS